MLVRDFTINLGFLSGSDGKKKKKKKNLPATQETWVQSEGQEDPLEKEMAIHPSILAWTIPWTEEPGRLQSIGSRESDMTEQLTLVNLASAERCLQTLFPGGFTHSIIKYLLRI